MAKIIKKPIILLVLAILAAATFACTPAKTVTADFDAILQGIYEYMPAEDLTEISREYLMITYGLDVEKCEKITALRAMSTTSYDEIIMLEIKKDENGEFAYAEKAEEIFTKLKSIKMKEVEDYANNPDKQHEYLKLDKAVMYRKQNYFFFAVSDNSTEIEEIIKNSIKYSKTN